LEASRALQALNGAPSVAQAIKRAVINRDTNYIPACVRRKRPVVSAQRFVSGQDANSTVACWNGKVLAGITVSVLERLGLNGPASVVQVIENPEISGAVEKIACRLELSGLFGFDFMIEERTGYAYLIEMNPRATQIGHLSLGVNRDLPASIRAVLAGEPVSERPRETDKEIIAFFPQEWFRDPASTFLRTAYHDVPWDEPDLVRACVEESPTRKKWRVVPVRNRLARGLELQVITSGGRK
jgi:hypothetical protein